MLLLYAAIVSVVAVEESAVDCSCWQRLDAVRAVEPKNSKYRGKVKLEVPRG